MPPSANARAPVFVFLFIVRIESDGKRKKNADYIKFIAGITMARLPWRLVS